MKTASFLCLLSLALLAAGAQAVDLRGSVSIRYSDGAIETPGNLHVFAVDRQEMDEYLRPLLPGAAARYLVLHDEFTALVLGYSPAMTESEKRQYERKKNELVEGFDAILPRLLTGFPGKPIASTVTDRDGKYRLTADGEFYIVVLASADDGGITIHHIWLVPDSDILGPYLELNERNRTANVYTLYRKFYPGKGN